MEHDTTIRLDVYNYIPRVAVVEGFWDRSRGRLARDFCCAHKCIRAQSHTSQTVMPENCTAAIYGVSAIAFLVFWCCLWGGAALPLAYAEGGF